MSEFQTLGLVFEDHEDGPSIARIYLQTYTSGTHRDLGKVVALTPVEYSANAFDEHADRLIENIQRLKREARTKFERAKRR